MREKKSFTISESGMNRKDKNRRTDSDPTPTLGWTEIRPHDLCEFLRSSVILSGFGAMNPLSKSGDEAHC